MTTTNIVGVPGMKRYCTADFRQKILKKFPQLEGNEPRQIIWRKLFMYLAFSSFYDKERGNKLLIPASTMYKELINKAWKYDNHWCFENVLNEFKKNVLPNLEWSGWTEDRARVVLNNGFDDEITELIKGELRYTYDASLEPGTYVWFVSGSLYDSASRQKNNLEERKLYEEEISVCSLNETQTKIVSYLSEVNGGHLFLRKMTENEDAINAALAAIDEEKRYVQHRILNSISQQPQPFYMPSRNGKTVRLTPCNDSVVGLKREVRKAFCKGWTECDLRSSQFAILAAYLEAPISTQFIRSGKSLWNELYAYAYDKPNEKPPSVIKDNLKRLFYSIPYGTARYMTKQFEAFNQTDKGKIKPIIPFELRRDMYEIPKKIEQHPIINELFDRREMWYREIKFNAGAYDAYAKWQTLKKGNSARSIGACIIQSIEMEIIYPIFEVAKARPDDVKICLFQHDGATLSFPKKDRKDAVIEQLKEAVENRAKKYGVITTLEFTDL